jgi:Signal transduction histidine kinase
VAKEACQPLNAHAQEHGHTIRCRFSGRPGTLIRADAEILKRLIGILLDNALKYTQGPDLIEVGIESGSDTVTLSVQDHGIGIPESDLPHVFERFYRSDRARDVAEGSGLGLAIAKWIADIHHAELKVTSKPGVGTRVDVLFPAYKDVESYVETAI